MIYTFNAKGFLLYPVMKSAFEQSDEDVYRTIQEGFELLQKQLSLKGIDYAELKGALIPNQEKDRFETCFFIDSCQIDSADYGYQVFKKMIPLLDRESTYSILCGDYIDIFGGLHSDSQQMLYSAMHDVLSRCHESRYKHSGQYYLIYINRLTGEQRRKIVEGLSLYSWFTGFADLSYNSWFKSYISNILVRVCIKNKGRVIMAHPSDYSDSEDINMRGFPFEDNGFSLCSISDDSYGAFLSYKIESVICDQEDISFSFNALFPKFDSLEKLQLNVSDDKWSKYLTDKEKGKGQIVELLGYDLNSRERFITEVYKRICTNYIYNLRENEYGDLIFNICVELPTVKGHTRKTTIALKYYPATGIIDVVTIT